MHSVDKSCKDILLLRKKIYDKNKIVKEPPLQCVPIWRPIMTDKDCSFVLFMIVTHKRNYLAVDDGFIGMLR